MPFMLLKMYKIFNLTKKHFYKSIVSVQLEAVNKGLSFIGQDEGNTKLENVIQFFIVNFIVNDSFAALSSQRPEDHKKKL